MVGYARVSAVGQSLGAQIDRLKERHKLFKADAGV